MKRLLGLTLLVALIATGMSCGDNGSPGGPSGPGDLQVRLTAPIGALDSAIEFTIAGPAPLTRVTAGAGLRLFQEPLGGSSTNFALIGPLTNGVQDLAVRSQYHGTITGVAMPNYQLRTLTGGYALALTR